MLHLATSYLALVRPVNLLITFFSIIAAGILAGGRWTDATPMFLAGLAGAAVAAGANAINDYFDVEIDRVNRPERPIPRGALSRQQARYVWLLTSMAGCACGWMIGPWPFAITVFSVALLYFYSRTLKATPLAGNVAVSGMTGMALIFGGTAIGAAENTVVPALFAFLVNLAREVVKDIEDREGDSRQRVTTLPVMFGIRPARLVATTALILLIAITILAYARGLYNDIYLFLVLVADSVLLYVAMAVWWRETPAQMRRLSVLLKATMVVGLAAIFFGRRI